MPLFGTRSQLPGEVSLTPGASEYDLHYQYLRGTDRLDRSAPPTDVIGVFVDLRQTRVVAGAVSRPEV